MTILRIAKRLHGVRLAEVGDQHVNPGVAQSVETVTRRMTAASVQVMPYPHEVFFVAPLKADCRFQREFGGVSDQMKEGYLNRRKWSVASCQAFGCLAVGFCKGEVLKFAARVSSPVAAICHCRSLVFDCAAAAACSSILR